MNTALLVLRIIPGLLLMGHGLQKLVPPGYSPPLLHAAGHRGTGAGFESLGIRPAVVAAVLAGSAELAAGFFVAAGLLTPVGTVLVGAVMITAILKVHVSNGIWAAEGGFEFPLVLLTVGFAITALGPGSLSVDSWLGIGNWAGINWTINPVARSAIALAIGLAGGLVVGPGILGAEAHPDPREPACGALMPYASAGVSELWFGASSAASWVVTNLLAGDRVANRGVRGLDLRASASASSLWTSGITTAPEESANT